MAFLGRYANQPVDVMLRLPVDSLARMLMETSKIVEAENESLKRD
jgi:hypothetical protein